MSIREGAKRLELSVMTFNLRFQTTHDEDNAWTFRKDLAANILKKYRPTVAGTQEGLHEMMTDMQERLPEYDWIGEGRKGGTASEYNAIFYRKNELDVVDWGQFWLSEQPLGPYVKSWGATHNRICTWAHFKVKGKPQYEFLHYNTHLDNTSQLAREHGIRMLWERLSEHHERTGLSAILTGDMNAEPGNSVIDFLRGVPDDDGTQCDLKDAYSIMRTPPGLSIHEFQGGSEGQPIDYIFVSPEARVEDVSIIRDQPGGKYPSDHYPVLAKLIF